MRGPSFDPQGAFAIMRSVMRFFPLGLALAIFFLFPGGAGSQEPPAGKAAPSSPLGAPAAPKLGEEELRKKLGLLSGLITEVNSRITSGDLSEGTLQNKRRYENGLRDLIIHFALTDQALKQVERLKQELDYLERPRQRKDARLRALRNFLKARFDDYTGFVSR